MKYGHLSDPTCKGRNKTSARYITVLNKHLPDLEGDVEFVDGGLYVHHDLPAHHGPGFLNFNISMLSP